jgi:hypothetical protein
LSSMGVDFRDLNDDGRPDLIVTALVLLCHKTAQLLHL